MNSSSECIKAAVETMEKIKDVSDPLCTALKFIGLGLLAVAMAIKEEL